MKVELSDLTREQLERLVLIQQGRLNRILKAVADHTEAGWKVRKAVDAEVETWQHRTEYVRDLALQQAQERREALQNETRWGRWRGT